MPHLFRSSLISWMSPLISSGFTSKECGLYNHMMVEGTGGPQNQLQVTSSPWSHCSALAHPLASLGCLWGFLSSIHTTVELRGLLGWMSTPPTSMCWNSSSHGDGIRAWMGSCPCTLKPAQLGHQWGSGLSPNTESASVMIFDFPVSELGETNICFLQASQFLVFLLQQPGRLRQGPGKISWPSCCATESTLSIWMLTAEYKVGNGSCP